LTDGDVVIHAPGFEDRTLAILDNVSGNAKARGILLDYRPFNEKNKLLEVRRGLSERGITISDEDTLIYDRFTPDRFEDELELRLLYVRARQVFVDISSMSKLAIMLVLQVCLKLDLATRILYSEAEAYRPTRDEFEHARRDRKIHRPTLHVFNGIHGVVRVDSLASVAMQGQPTAAIVFMSFNDALTQVLLNTVYPGRLFLINGRPPIHSWREAATAWVHEQVRREWHEDNPVERSTGADMGMPLRTASTLDYRDSVALLLDLYWQLSASHRILLAPSGSKMQTVACYIVKALHPDVHVEYPSPEGFAPEYSTGTGARWLLDLDRFSKTLKAISRIERETFLEISAIA
jgi:hypothetical protein